MALAKTSFKDNLLDIIESAFAGRGFCKVAYSVTGQSYKFQFSFLLLKSRNLESVLVVSSIRLIMPATHAASRRTMNSKPSLEIRVTYSEGCADDIADVNSES